ncbi:MAG: DEAD/DEAH box helicase family protein [Clostridia bacterium]|nr:DEAD/DEAH box helicase family protein [Clostridia bacterium]
MFLERCKFKASWRKYQEDVLKEFNKHLRDKKINIVAAPGSGKTTLGLEMICRLNQHVLILTPTITIKNQWKERFLEAFVPNGMQVDFISDDIYNLNKFNVATYQALHYALNKKKIKEDETGMDEEESNTRIKTEAIDYDLVKVLKDKKIKTIVLDEAHHLRAEWWKSLSEVISSVDDVRVISLTATPPYDVDENEWKRYEEVCGTIDAEISVPELVATGDLCPHQDYVIFNGVTKAEANEIKEIRENIDSFFESLKQNKEFSEMLKSNSILKDWQKNEEVILSDIEFYSSMIIYLNSVGENIDKGLVKLISNNLLIPQFDKKWAEILLKNVLYTHKEDFKEYEALIGALKKNLEILGCAEKKNVYLNDVNAIKKIMASSIAKMDSIDKIVSKEYEALKENLSMVILADYVRSDYIDYSMENINKIGVVPIFRRLLAKKVCENMAILTGKLKVIPKKLIPYIDEQLKSMNIGNDGIYSDLVIDNNYVVIKGGKKVETAIVKIVTECVNQKKINVIIGTVALLGEGWDAPAVNSLILASYVGSYMLSNQMRGRAIRKSRAQNKTANIWHLASLADLGNNNIDFTDLDLLERRFSGFVGIAYYEDVIQNGMERLSIIDRKELKKNYEKVNEEMYSIALNRDLMASRWKKIIDLFGGTNIKMVDKLNGDFKINTKVFLTMDVKKFLLSVLIANIIITICMAIVGISNSIGRYIINIFIAVFYLIRIIRHMNPLNYIKQIGKVILNSMVVNKKLQTNRALVSNEFEQFELNGKIFYKVYLKGATVYENNLFVRSFEEVYSKVADTRYIILVGKKTNVSKDTYFNVPDIFDNDKNEAIVFLNQWNSNLCKGTLIYTKSKEGRKMLMKARRNSYAYSESFFVRKEASKWM